MERAERNAVTCVIATTGNFMRELNYFFMCASVNVLIPKHVDPANVSNYQTSLREYDSLHRHTISTFKGTDECKTCKRI